MSSRYFCVVLALLPLVASAQDRPLAEFPLWPDGAPLATGTEPGDIPTLTAYWPTFDRATGSAVVICPGGGYGHLAPHEGQDYAKFLARHGVAGFVLKYRLATAGYHHPAMLMDVQRAIRTVRANAAAWGLDPGRIGVMGSSAGGHLASTASTHYDGGDLDAEDPIERASCRPDATILCYPVISMLELTHGGSRNNLLGPEPDTELMRLLSSELQVTADTPPAFIWHTWEDTAVKVENAMMYAAALRAAGVMFDLHIYERGAHGLGLGVRDYTPAKDAELLPWTADLVYWLKARGFIGG